MVTIKYKLLFLVATITILSVLVASCASPTPETVIMTLEVVETVVVEKEVIKTVEVIAPSEPLALSDAQKSIASRLEAYFQELASQGLFSGAVLIKDGEKSLLEKGFGFSDRAQSQENLPISRFRIDNISMQLTALAAYSLISQGRLSVDAPACDYLDSCPEAWMGFTIRDLLYNTTTLPDYSYVSVVLKQDVSQPISVDELLIRLQQLPVADAPAPGQWVGDANFSILGAVIEELTGMKFGRFLTESLLNPLQMGATGLAQGNGENEEVALQYRGPGKDELAAPVDLSHLYTGGGMYSNVYDLERFLNAFQSDQYLPRDMIATMLLPDAEGRLGYGWMRYDHSGQQVLTTVFTEGDLYGSMLAMTPNAEKKIIFLVNQDLAPIGSLDKVLEIMAGK